MSLALIQPLQAQFVVYDPAQFANMIKSIANEAQLISNAAKTLKETKNILQTAIRTKEEIENIYHLQWQVQEALKVARGIKDLKWSDLDGVTRAALDISIDPIEYFPDFSGTYHIRQALRLQPSAQHARQLYGLLVGQPVKGELPQDLASFEKAGVQLTLNQFAVSELRDEKKVLAALSYYQLAEEMIYQARELMEAVKRDQRLTMNEAERLHSLKQCQDVLMKSMEIKLEADELLRSVTEQPSRARDALRQSYRNQLLRKALAEEPQMKWGQ